TAPAGMTIDPSSGLIRWTPSNAQVGARPVTLRLTDGPLSAKTQSFTITVRNTNDAPTITSTPPTPAGDHEGYRYAITVSAARGGDTFSFALVTGPPGMGVDSASGLLTWTPGQAAVGQSFPVPVSARDAAGATATQSFSLPVVEVNNAPSIVSTPPA